MSRLYLALNASSDSTPGGSWASSTNITGVDISPNALGAILDEVARELTVQAGRQAGLPRLVLVEELQDRPTAREMTFEPANLPAAARVLPSEQSAAMSH